MVTLTHAGCVSCMPTYTFYSIIKQEFPLSVRYISSGKQINKLMASFQVSGKFSEPVYWLNTLLNDL